MIIFPMRLLGFLILNISALDELSTLSFIGIKMGDLNGSANPNNWLVATERKELPTLALSTKDQKIEVGETVQLSINAKNLQNIKGYQFSVVNSTSQIIDQSIHEVTVGQQMINLTTANWSVGIYILKLTNEQKLLQSIRMIKG